MSVPAADSHPFRRLLVALIDHDPRRRNTRRLAIDANIVGRDFPGFKKLNKALLNNWVRPKDNSTPQDWRQLAALLKAFDVDENLADIMFRVTTRGWDLKTLQDQTSPGLADLLKFRQPVLSFRQPTLNPTADKPYEIVPATQGESANMSGSVELVHFATDVEPTQAPVLDVIVEYIRTDYQTRPALLDSAPSPGWKRARPAIGVAAALLVAVGVVMWARARPSGEQDEAQTLNEQTPETTTVALPASPEQELFSCDVDLDTIPAANIFEKIFLTGPGCEKIDMRVQYDTVGTDDLNPWEEALNACWAGAVHRLWLHATPQDSAPGWVGIQSQAGFDDSRSTVEMDLHAEPDENSEIVGSYLHAELTKRVDQIRFTLPTEPDPKNYSEELGGYHIGGCWKGQPREDGNGVHFYYVD